MALSDNTVFVQLALDLGLENVSETARSMDLTTAVNPYPATAIGGLRWASARSRWPLPMRPSASGMRREPSYALERTDHEIRRERLCHVGYTPMPSLAVWVGYQEGRESMVGVHDTEKSTGLTLPMGIWSLYWPRLLPKSRSWAFPAATGVSSSP
jgi:membrane peptidoglycan carboxypeptidase